MARIPVQVLLITAVFMWGANFNMAPVAIETLPTLTAAGSRFLLSALFMIGLVLIRREFPGYLRSIRSRAVLLAGFFGIGCFNLLFFFAITLSTAINTSLIMAATP